MLATRRGSPVRLDRQRDSDRDATRTRQEVNWRHRSGRSPLMRRGGGKYSRSVDRSRRICRVRSQISD
jgi:hypothetical protein